MATLQSLPSVEERPSLSLPVLTTTMPRARRVPAQTLPRPVRARKRVKPPPRTSPGVVAQLRERASRDARRLRSAASDLAELTALEEVAVGPETGRTYQGFMADFSLLTLEGKAFSAVPVARAQRQIMSHLSLLFSLKRPASDGMKFLAAVGHFFPMLGKGSRTLPRARRMVQGWAKTTPAGSRVPPPNCAVCGVAVEMVREGQQDMAIAALVAHQAYLRPDELHSLRRRDVVPPQGGRGNENMWSLVLGPLDTRTPTKTGIFDDSVVLDHPTLMWLGPHMHRLRNAGDLDECIWPFSREAFGRTFAKCVRRLGLQKWGFVPYSLRHSGPSWDRSEKRLSLLEVQRRGRWMDPRTVVRYERSSRTSVLLSTLTRSLVAYLRRCEDCLQQYVEASRPLPRLPGADAETSS